MPATSNARRPSGAASGNPISDAELREQIGDFLRERGLTTIEVAASDGAVALTGRVSSAYERQMAVLSVRRIAGVVRLSDQIRIVPVAAPKSTATQRVADLGGGLWQALADWFVGTSKLAWLVVLAGLVVPISMASCGSPSEKQVAVHPVKGRVTLNGAPASGAQVVLHAVGHSLPEKTVPSARVGDDGTFEVGVYRTGDGAPPGDYVVTVVWNKVVTTDGGSGPGPNVLPREFSSPETSPVKVTVKQGPNEIPPIEVKK